MSVETQHHSHAGGNFNVASVQNELLEAAPLNLTQFQRRNGRKRNIPQKSAEVDEYAEDVSSDDAFHEDSSTDEEKKMMISEEAKAKAKSILEHYRSFMQRNTVDFNDELHQIAKRAKLMKTSSVGAESMSDHNVWEPLPSHQKSKEIPTGLEAMLNGPVHGPNGLIPERTMRQNNWAIKVWRDWALTRNRQPENKLDNFPKAPVDIRVTDVESMSYWLPKFIREVRRKDKKPYPADTLMQIASGLQRYLRQVSCRSEVNFFDKYSSTFAEFRDALKTRSGELSMEAQASKSGKRIQVDNLNEDELWQSGYLDCATAKGIFHVMFYYNCVEFEITSMEEHHELKVEQFTFATDPNKNKEYVEFTRSDQRYYNMSTKQVMRRYLSPEDTRCIVKLYKAYLDLVPSTGPFYRRPLQTPENSSPRFSFNPVGINKLRETYKQLFSPDRPASLRRSGQTTTIRHMSHHSNDQDQASSPQPQPPLVQPLNNKSQAVYDAITQKLKSTGHLRSTSDDAVDLSVKTNDSFESDDDTITSLTTENVLDQIKKKWQGFCCSRDLDAVKREPDSEDMLVLKVPPTVKYVIVEKEGKKMTFSLNK